jgi:hypothetical protein
VQPADNYDNIPTYSEMEEITTGNLPRELQTIQQENTHSCVCEISLSQMSKIRNIVAEKVKASAHPEFY